jgi:hypothetical protein
METIKIIHQHNVCQKTFPDGMVEQMKPVACIFEFSNEGKFSWDTIERLAKLFKLTGKEAENYFTVFEKDVKRKPSPKKRNDLKK